MCRLQRTSSDVGRGENQSCGGCSAVGGKVLPSEVGEIDSMESPVVMACVPVSTVTSTWSGALWRAPLLFFVLRMAACMSWQAALWKLMRKASWSRYSPAIWVHESGM